MGGEVILRGEAVTRRFGGLVAVNRVDFTVHRGEIFGLIGPNGAGKTTLFQLIAGAVPLTSGTIRFKGQVISGLKASEVCRKGVARTFQIPRPFAPMSVLQNITIGVLYGRRGESSIAAAEGRAREILALVGLEHQAAQVSRALSIGDMKRLEIAKALATDPELLLLDEVMGGLTPAETERTMELIKQVRDQGVTVVMIEHVMRAVMTISDRIMVLHLGEKLTEGTPQEVTRNPQVIQAYLGKYTERTQKVADGG